MNAVDLLGELAARGVDLRAEGDRLRCLAPEGALTDRLRERITANKQDLLALLREGDTDRLVPDPAHAHEPFPLGDIQQAYWIGRGNGFDVGVAAHSYAEYDRDEALDPARLERAWSLLLRRHPMLRAVVDEDGRQRVLPEAPAHSLPVHDLRGLPAPESGRRLAAVRQRLSHRAEAPGSWPPFKIELSLLDGRCRTHLSGDLVAADAWSWQILARDLGACYQDPDAELPPLQATFRDYVLAGRRQPVPAADLAYWREKAATLPPPPELPLAGGHTATDRPRFTRLTGALPPAVWERLRKRGARENLTPSTVLLAAYSVVIAEWSKNRRFCLNQTLFDRRPLHPGIGDVVGDFTNFTLLDVDCGSGLPFADHARALRDQLFEHLTHSSVSGVRILREATRQRGGHEPASAPVVFTSILSSRGQAMDAFAWLGRQVHGVSQTPQVRLDQQLYEEDGALVITWDLVEGLFADQVPESMFDAYQGLLDRLARDDEPWRSARPVSLAPAVRAARDRYNATGDPYEGHTLHGLFSAAAAAAPDAPAVITGERVLTYRDVDDRSRAVARLLRERGVRPGDLVGVATEKGWEQVVAVLAVLRAGAAYLPLDPHWPAARRDGLLADAGVRHLLIQPWTEGPWPAGLDVAVIEEEAPEGSGTPYEDHPHNPEDLAYTIFTSGSTGRPKGVAITHHAAANTVLDVNQRFGVTRGDRVLGVSALTFDLSVWDVFGTLAAGGALVLPGPEARRDPLAWAELMERHGVTVWNSAPALLRLLTDALGERRLRTPLRLVLLSGDWIPVTLPDRVRTLAPGARVVALGGATEGAIWSIHHRVDKVDAEWHSIPYGAPLRGQRVYVLDERLDERPDWVVGEICIGGAGLATGYLGAPEQTARSFVVRPSTGERIYRTGDLGRFRPEGWIEFLGREDQQVKLNGHRIELEEIESALLGHPAVTAAAVTVRGDGHRRHLAAYAVPRAGGDSAAADEEELLAHLAARLPEVMVPRTLAFVSALPLTANGKIDRARLAAERPTAVSAGRTRETNATDATDATDPMDPPDPPDPTDTEGSVLAGVMATATRVLDLDLPDPDMSLLAAGADSLGLVRLALALGEEFGRRPPVEELFRLGSPRAIATWCARRQAPGGEAEDGPASAGAFTVLTDPAARSLHTASRPALRPGGAGALPLPDVPVRETPSAKRRTARRFAPDAVPAGALAGLLGALRQSAGDDGVRARYPSAGAVHSVQTYVEIRPGRVAGIPGGTYYYHPGDHALLPTGSGGGLPDGAHWPANRATAGTAAFSLHLVMDRAALEPLYGEQARDLALIEAGCQTQLLATVAPAHGLGLCPVAGAAQDEVRTLFALGDARHAVFCLLGGALPRPGGPDGSHTAPGDDRKRGGQ
ncbi:amino acid adenylation domain-containing protein [Streptomyces sp. NPDC006923]|uniref:non-ribosomal peptide synthetase n=1 Tax=Streptomyces sp. NPDC006923 TaxID=3155355 RepID=UPI0034082DDC